MADVLIYEVSDRIATMTLNMPERRNALGDVMIEAVIGGLERFRDDADARVLIITGEGSSFCSGGDLKMIDRWQGADGGGGDAGEKPKFDPIAQRDRYRFGIQQIPLTFAKVEKPIIAAVNGPAIGAGCDMSLMCDIRIAGAKARFGETFCKVGLAPGDGGAYFLSRIVGIEKACELTFTGDVIDAAEAVRIGMASRVVPQDELMAEARKLAAKIAGNPPLALKMAKFALYKGQHQTLPESLELMALMQSMLHGTEDHVEGVKAFLEKRAPEFTGR